MAGLREVPLWAGAWAEAVEAYTLATDLRKKDKPAKAALAEAKKKAGGK